MTRLTDRDSAILRTCAACQVLTTSQVHQLHFDGVTVDAAQKRLRKLATAGYLDAIETRIGTEFLYALGKAGRERLRALGWNMEPRDAVPKDLRHHLGVNDIRIAVLRGLERASLRLRYFYAYWELGQFAWNHPLIPDAILSVRNACILQAAIEFDRGTESLAVFAKKLLRYQPLLRLHPLSTVILVAEERANVERLEQGLGEVHAVIPLLTVAMEDLKEQGLAACPYPRNHMFGTRTISEQMEIDAVRQLQVKP